VIYSCTAAVLKNIENPQAGSLSFPRLDVQHSVGEKRSFLGRGEGTQQ
jgi:hypothetical protein